MPFVADAHTLVWHLTGDSSLSAKARDALRKVDEGEEELFIPCIVFFELTYLVEKRRIAADFDDLVGRVSSSHNYRIEPLCLPIIEKGRSIPMDKVKDPWDRLIAGTSMHLGLPLISRDRSLAELGLKVIW